MNLKLNEAFLLLYAVMGHHHQTSNQPLNFPERAVDQCAAKMPAVIEIS